ncbi:MAG: glutathione S-transferase family protein [Deltaproteobacteria bacterium]|nr:glutathione S-transferase family protein [Deltaproteobacteria bacterium]
MPVIVLHQWLISPFCGKVRRILEHKGLAYEVVEYSGLLARKAKGLTKTGKLPVLDYDGERIQDSSDIARFLEAKHPSPAVFPRDPVLRAQAHFWEDWADESLYWFEVYLRFMYPEARTRSVALLAEGRSKLERAILGRVVQGMYKKKLHAQGLGRMTPERVEARLVDHLDALEVLLGQRRWLVGEDRSIADIAVGSQLAEITRTSHFAPEVARREHVSEWLARA